MAGALTTLVGLWLVLCCAQLGRSIGASPGLAQHKVFAQTDQSQAGTEKLQTSGANKRPAIQHRQPARAPRGFCVRISRAIKATSPCYKHLVLANDQRPGPEDHKRHDERLARGSPSSQGQVDAAGGLRAERTVPAESAHQLGSRRRHEELVYIRTETLGDEIASLSTQAINERLVDGLLSRLIVGQGARVASSAINETAEEVAQDRMIEEIRQQISGASSQRAGGELMRAQKCREAVEKLICRLVYPTCHFRSSDAGALVRPPCREDCLVLRDEICPNLSWPKFSLALQRAFTTTLRASINALDLLVDGDPAAAPSPQVVAPDKQQTQTDAASEHRMVLTARVNHQTDAPGQSTQDQFVSVQLTPRSGATSVWSPSGHNLSSSLHFYWPHEHSIDRCDFLPPLRPLGHGVGASLAKLSHDATPRSKWMLDQRRSLAVCSNAHLTEISVAERGQNKVVGASGTKSVMRDDLRASFTLECLQTSNGVDYEGTKNVTRSGLPCQLWQDQFPHKHRSSELLFDNMKDSHNYCRNPGGLDANGPFCYTLLKEVRWEYCQIEKCESKQ